MGHGDGASEWNGKTFTAIDTGGYVTGSDDVFEGAIREQVPIPESATENDSHISFGVLRDAQSLGDREALMKEGRPVLRIELGGNQADELTKLINAVDDI